MGSAAVMDFAVAAVKSGLKTVWGLAASLMSGGAAGVAMDAAGAASGGGFGGISVSQLKYVGAMVASIPLSAGMRWLPKGNARHAYASATTLGLLCFTYGGRDALKFVAAGALVYSFMRLFPRRCGALTWATMFSYQLYLHWITSSQTNWEEGTIDMTGSFMMLVLRLISVAMDYQDGLRATHVGVAAHAEDHAAPASKEAPPAPASRLSPHMFSRCPTFLEFFGYLGGFGALMAGPHFYYDDYLRYANDQGEYAVRAPGSGSGAAGEGEGARGPIVWGAAAKALGSALCCAGLFTTLGDVSDQGLKALPLSVDGAGAGIGLGGRYVLCVLSNFVWRLKFYFAWHLAETGMIISGFGFSGYSTHDGTTPVWFKAVNSGVLEVEAAPSVALAVKRWNRHTGEWLRNYVYDRVPMGGLSALLVTQTVCGLWHGVSWNFVVFFAHSALIIQCSRILHRIQTQYLSPSTRPYTDAMHALFSWNMLNYIACAYTLRSMRLCMAGWRALHYLGHATIVCVYALGFVFPRKPKRGMGQRKRKMTADDGDHDKSRLRKGKEA